MNTQFLRRRMADDAIDTASPARLVTMLYDRLVRDLVMAEQAVGVGDRLEAEKQLLHAQDIVIELRTSLKLEIWDGAESLAGIYGFLLGELMRANVRKDVARIASCRGLVQPLREAWHEAARGLAAEGATPIGAAIA